MTEMDEIYDFISRSKDDGYITEKEAKEYVRKLIESYVDTTLKDLKTSN